MGRWISVKNVLLLLLGWGKMVISSLREMEKNPVKLLMGIQCHK